MSQVCVLMLDDEKINRMIAPVIWRIITGTSHLPPEWDKSTNTCVSPKLLVLGETCPDIDQILKWVESNLNSGSTVLCVSDQDMYYGQDTLFGSDVLKQLKDTFGDSRHLKMFIRSGNSADLEKYKESGSLEYIPKSMKIRDVGRILLGYMGN